MINLPVDVDTKEDRFLKKMSSLMGLIQRSKHLDVQAFHISLHLMLASKCLETGTEQQAMLELDKLEEYLK